MFCPSCGSNNSIEQKFCRSCGMNLETVAGTLMEQFPTAERATLRRQEKSLERFGNFAFAGLGAIVFAGVIGVLYVIVSRMILTGDSVAAGILFAAFIVFASLALAFVFFNEVMKDKRRKLENRPAERPELSGMSTTGGALYEGRQQPAEGIPSVIEDTTKLLHANPDTRKL